jgi:N-methylhydantoinase A
VTSSSVVREYYEFERTSTAPVQGYCSRSSPAMRQSPGEAASAASRADARHAVEWRARAAEAAREPGREHRPVGPGCGGDGGRSPRGEAGFDNVITGDMGGTSYDVAVVVGGNPARRGLDRPRFPHPAPPADDRRAHDRAGGRVRSRISIAGGILQVGPAAQALCRAGLLRRGGTEPTVTDVNAVLSRINADHPIGLKNLTRSTSRAHARDRKAR